ncbi:MAG TPA: hypothetical protein ENK49_07195 [Gammaproteobacteria bacterium]|nr:hypothetical protein [Gammaproteobacteria bacterium]
MELDQALKIVALLADGIDPHTGEVFPDDSPYQQPQTIRALYTLIRAVEGKATSTTNDTKPQPRKAGASWTPEEDQQLTDAFKRDEPVAQIAQLHERSQRAIEARLVRLGLVEERWQAR